MSKDNRRLTVFANIVSGNLCGMVQMVTVQPIDTVKVRMQLNNGRFTGALDCIRKTINREGFQAFYKGLTSPLFGVGAVNALLFTTNSTIKKSMEAYPGQILTLSQIALAGAGAGLVSSVLIAPVEVLKIKLQAQFGSAQSTRQSRYFTGPIDCAKYLIEKDGIRRGLFRGTYATALREMPAYAGFYTGFEATKRYLTRRQENEPSTLQLVASGSVGGLCYWLSCYPMDVVKSVVQHQEKPPRGLYATQVIKDIVGREGVQAMFRGLAPTLVRSMPGAAVTFTTFELSMRTFRDIGWV